MQTEKPNTPEKNKKLKDRQKEILDYLLKFRHLNRPQIQTLLNHKYREKILKWLDDLVQRQFIFKFYTKEFAGKPSTYCLDIGSKEYLRQKDIDQKFIKRLADEKTHSQQFRDHCMFVATMYLSLQVFAKENNLTLRFHSKADLYGIKYLILPNPDAFFDLKEQNKIRKRYFLDTFDDSVFMKKRVYQYLYYYRKNYWQDSTKKKFPNVILVFPTQTAKQNMYKFIQKRLTTDAPTFYLATKEDIQIKGMCREILQKVEENNN